jgi:excisionase family DNA binding protein
MDVTVPRDQVFTTGEVARVCRVAGKTVIRWLDGGLLPCYRVPGTNHRRVTRRHLERFMAEHALPTELLAAHLAKLAAATITTPEANP